jgi:hypothetical protein
MKIINRLDIFIFAIIGLSLVVTLFQPEFHALAVGNSVTSVSAPAQPVNSNQQFSVSIMVQPNSPISGAQFNLSFNPALATINSITEGNLFNQNGASTYFLGGTINNTAGTVSGVADAIIGAGKNVSAVGSLAVINMTARTTGGTSALNLSNVILADANGQSVPVNTINGQVVINGTTTSTTTTPTTTTTTHTTTTVTTTASTISPAPPAGGGGGGGGGGAAAGLGAPTSVAGVMDVSNIVNVHGVFSLAVSPWSDDKKVVMVVNGGTTATTLTGAPITQISIQHLKVAPDFPAGAGIASLGYNFLPSDAKISPSSIVRFQYDPTLIPPDVSETSLQVAYFDTVNNKWVSLPSDIDTNNHFVTAQITSFDFYAVTYGVKNMAAAPTTVVPSVTPTTSTTTSSTIVATPVLSSAPALVTSATTELTKTTAISMPILPISPAAGTTNTQGPRVVRLSLLAITIGVDAILDRKSVV